MTHRRRRALATAVITAVITAMFAAPLHAQYHRPNVALLAAETVGGAALFAASDHVLDSPSPWTQDGRGYRRRLDVRLVQFGVANLTEQSLFALVNDDGRFHPCTDCRGWRARTRHVLRESAFAHDASGARRLAWPVVAGAIAGAAASAPQLPSDYRLSWILTRPLTTIGARVALFTWYEIAPTALGGRRGVR
ncbi:MAG: hypothetical protein MUF00_14305 [Gemmatimonadaceae bacterium]|jgi:hypothetical protein|nr:hypothetical protein [Gemmatimonadaceae bacterium]